MAFRTYKLINTFKNALKIQQFRNASYNASPLLVDLGEIKRDYEITNDPEEWKFVERALASPLIPEPVAKKEYPSGWTPQSERIKELPYSIARTKNHMIPVYMNIMDRGSTRWTYIKKIRGDIWQMEKEIVEFLQKDQKRPIRSQVNEFFGHIIICGDYVNAVKYFLNRKGF